MKRLLISALALALSAPFLACNNHDKPPINPDKPIVTDTLAKDTLPGDTLPKDTIPTPPGEVKEVLILSLASDLNLVSNSGGVVEFTLTSNTSWRIVQNTVYSDMCKLSAYKGENDAKITITVSANESLYPRSSEFTITTESELIERVITIQQAEVGVSNLADSLALIALYNSTDGASWAPSFSGVDRTWKLSEPLTSWNGVKTARQEDGTLRVVSLVIPDRIQGGTIPEEITKLDKLTKLDLSFSKLTGEIPANIGDLKNLTIMYLHNNLLSGSLPSSITSLSNIIELKFDNNQLSGTLPDFSKFDKMDTFNISGNNITGGIPESLVVILNKELLYLNLYNNRLSGNVPAAILSHSKWVEKTLRLSTNVYPQQNGYELKY